MAMKNYEQDCPLCKSGAEYVWVDYENRKYFKCPTCGSFQISRRAEKELDEQSAQFVDYVATQALSTPADHIFLILMSEHNTGTINLSYVPKSEAPLN